MISESEAERYRRDGYLLVRGALSATQLVALIEGVERITARWSPTGDGYERVLHQIHHPWLHDEAIASVVTDPWLARAAKALSGMDDVKVFLDQIIVKPVDGHATISHQDAPFLSFDDDRSLGCWIALDRVTKTNGALAYRRGSHHLGPLPRIHLDEDDSLLRMVLRLRDLPEEIVEMSPGDAVFHNCRTVHRAGANRGDRPRRAFSLQYMPADARYNGYHHDFLSPYTPSVGTILDFPCFAVPQGSKFSPPPLH